jgi:VWFA-related protein
MWYNAQALSGRDEIMSAKVVRAVFLSAAVMGTAGAETPRNLLTLLTQSEIASVLSQETPQKPPPEPPEPTIDLRSTLVDVVFSVTDEKNRFVRDLTPESIVVLEDGIAQKIEFFGRNTDVPMVVALAIDFSGSQEFNWPAERQAAEKFFAEAFRWGKDYAAFVSFRSTVELHRGLTSDPARLAEALQSLVRRDEGYASQGTSLYDAIYITVEDVLDGPTARRLRARNENRIRRALIVITDGHDTSSGRKLAEAIERAQRAGVLVYAIGLSDSFRFADVNAQVLGELTQATGGRAFYPRSEDDLRLAFNQIAEDLSSQYLVAYYPTNSARDGRFRRLQVKIRDHENWTVAHRAGYVAPKER